MTVVSCRFTWLTARYDPGDMTRYGHWQPPMGQPTYSRGLGSCTRLTAKSRGYLCPGIVGRSGVRTRRPAMAGLYCLAPRCDALSSSSLVARPAPNLWLSHPGASPDRSG